MLARSSSRRTKKVQKFVPQVLKAIGGVSRRTCVCTAVSVLILLQFCASLGRWSSQVRASPEDIGAGAVDYIGLVLKPSCVTKLSIQELVRLQQPRRIYVVTPEVELCVQHLLPLADSVSCLHEDQVLPGIRKETIHNGLLRRFPELHVSEFQMGRTPAGWYFQQILKLGAAQGVASLSEVYVIWDFDMLPLRPLRLFVQSALSTPGDATDATQWPNIVHIGGNNAHGYDAAYRSLFGRKLESAPDGTSFVTHWVVARKTLMLEFLKSMQNTDSAVSWVDSILDHIPPEDVFQGFSEYASYVSWVRQHYPATQVLARKKVWRRQPFGGAAGMRLAKWQHAHRLCCPRGWQQAWQRWLGYHYSGFEIGHHSFCQWEEHPHHYGLEEP